MTYQQAGRIAVLKRILGWVIFIPALISTLISLLKFMNTRQENQEGINAVMLDFTHVMIDMMQANTPFLNLFWYNSPTPNFNGGVNVMFWVARRASCGKVLKINSFWKKPKGKRG